MTIYAAGATGPREVEAALTASGLLRARLCTFADRPQVARVLEWQASCGGPLFLDSGAFSASTRGARIDLGEYCEFVQEHRGQFAAYAVLDVIGDAAASDANLREMLRRGLEPLPIVHPDEPLSVLESLCREFGRVAFGGLNIAAQRGLAHTADMIRPRLDACFEVVGRCWPVRVHLLGVGQQWVLERYPAASADTTSAIRGAGMGLVHRRRRDGTASWVHWSDALRTTWDGRVADGVAENAYAGRWAENLREQACLQRHVTDLWAAKGVAWA